MLSCGECVLFVLKIAIKIYDTNIDPQDRTHVPKGNFVTVCVKKKLEFVTLFIKFDILLAYGFRNEITFSTYSFSMCVYFFYAYFLKVRYFTYEATMMYDELNRHFISAPVFHTYFPISSYQAKNKFYLKIQKWKVRYS